MFELKQVDRQYYISCILGLNTVSPFAYPVKFVASNLLFLKCLI
jgi:hypothetical protein